MGTETLMLLAALSCSGLCCLGVAVVLLGGVLYVMNSQDGSSGSLPWPLGGSTQASAPVSEAAPSPAEPPLAGASVPSPMEDDRSTVMVGRPGDGDLGPPIDPHAPSPPPRSSGQTIIAFDDEDDDY